MKPNARCCGRVAKLHSLRSGASAPDYYCMDGTIPRSQLSFVLNEIYRLSEAIRAAGRQCVSMQETATCTR